MSVVIFIIMLAGGLTAPVGGYPFITPEIPLVEPEHSDFYKEHIDTTFDMGNNAHAVWIDWRDGMGKIFGNTVLRDRTTLISYPSYTGDPAIPHSMPVILSDQLYPDRLYVLGTTDIVDPQELLLARYDLNLPGSVNPQDISSFPLMESMISDFQAVWTMDNLNFVFVYDTMLFTGTYSIVSNTWIEFGPIDTNPDIVFSNPRLARDNMGYIYLTYNRFNTYLMQNTLVVRRSIEPCFLAQGFGPERQVDFDVSYEMVPSIAATGPGPAPLSVSIAYYREGATFPVILCATEVNGPWGAPVPLGGWVAQVNTPYDILQDVHAGYDRAGRLYVVWVSFDQLLGDISHDTGMSFGADRMLTPAGMILSGPVSLALGNIAGNVAIGFMGDTGTSIYANPYMLVSMSDIYDACDMHPSLTGFWDTYTGVEVDIELFHGNTGYPLGSYRLTTESLRDGDGVIRDYGLVEQQGLVELYFYDSESVTADFTVGLDNANARGVMRMLGVRNETNTHDYQYYNGTEWIDWASRANGWHHVIITVDDDGIEMKLEAVPDSGTYVTYQDAVFTSFTSIFIEGGSETDPYNVDDIRVETIPLGAPPVHPLPVDTLWSILILTLILGIVLSRLR